ncbi:MAG: D-alanine--D-alanine ligase [Pseudomonadota bacterium]
MVETHKILPAEFGRVGVMMGGWSAEREISLMSGKEVLQGLLDAGVDAVGVDLDLDTLRAMKREDYDRAFMILHGPGGEDGIVQAFLETIGVPYTGSGVLGSAIAMSKFASKLAWRGVGLPVPDWHVVSSAAEAQSAADEFGFPMMIKPSNEGSSIGIEQVNQREALVPAFETAVKYGEVLAEKFVHGRELTVAVLGGQALPVIEIETPREFYDYKAKYFVDNTSYHCPAKIPESLARQCQEIALSAFDSIGCRDWGRVDFMVDGDGQPWLIEANTAPGMTTHSLVPMAANEAGMTFSDLVYRILECSMEREA